MGHGIVVTYAQVASHPARHRVRTESRRTLVIFDEIHHGGDAKSWGDSIREVFGDATRRLALTGTPFRSDDAANSTLWCRRHTIERASRTGGFTTSCAASAVVRRWLRPAPTSSGPISKRCVD
jgi:hypothetical protein